MRNVPHAATRVPHCGKCPVVSRKASLRFLHEIAEMSSLEWQA